MIPTLDPKLKIVKTQVELATKAVVAQIDKTTVTTAAEYAAADALLTRIRTNKAIVLEKLNPIIEPIYLGLESLYALRREMLEPLESGEKSIKLAMGVFKQEERRQIAEARRVQQAEIDRLAALEEEKKAKMADAATPQMRSRLRTQLARVEEQRTEALSAPPPTAVKAAGSRTRTTVKWEVTDLGAVFQGVRDGVIPAWALTVDERNIDVQVKADRTVVEKWPGIRVYEEITVVGR